MASHVLFLLAVLRAAEPQHPLTAVAPAMPALAPASAPAPWPGLDGIVWTWCSLRPNSREAHRVAACTDGRYYYVCGGMDLYGPTRLLHRYDPVSDEWISLAYMPGPNSNHCLIYLPPRNKLYVVGGYNRSGALNVNWEYDIASDTWAVKGTFPVRTWGTAGAALGDSVFVNCGDGSGFGQFYRYDPATDSWERRPDMTQGVRCTHGAAAASAGKYYYCCGWDRDSSMREYDPATGVWTLKRFRPLDVHGLGIAVFGDSIYTYGGAQFWTNTFDDVFVYDVPGDSWYRETDMLRAMGANNITGGPCRGAMFSTSGGLPNGVHIRGEPNVVAVSEMEPAPLPAADPGRARIYDITGREVRPGRPGVYFVRGGAGTRKVIVR